MGEEQIEITKEEYEAYEDVRASGRTNMFMVKTVEDLSGLSRPKIMAIMKQYEDLEKKYPGVRDQAMENNKRPSSDDDEEEDEDEE